MQEQDKLRKWAQQWSFWRDIILFFGGLMGVANEAIWQATADPTLLLLYGAMMGLPAFLRKDQERRNSKDDEDDN